MIRATIGLAIGMMVALACFAAEPAHAEGSASGTWTWVIKGRQGRPNRTIVATLKAQGGKLTGTVSAPDSNREMKSVEIHDGIVKGDQISFATTREVNGTEATTKYSGKVAGDEITGRMDFERNGEPVNRDWVAKRKK